MRWFLLVVLESLKSLFSSWWCLFYIYRNNWTRPSSHHIFERSPISYLRCKEDFIMGELSQSHDKDPRKDRTIQDSWIWSCPYISSHFYLIYVYVFMSWSYLCLYFHLAVRCPSIQRPQDGGVVPMHCSLGKREFGQRCVVYCKHGYRLTGPATKYCQADKSWSNNAPNECVKGGLIYSFLLIYFEYTNVFFLLYTLLALL